MNMYTDNQKMGDAAAQREWGGLGGEYDKLYGGLLHTARIRIHEQVRQINKLPAKNRADAKEIRIFDFGCGTGRYFPLLEEIAKKDGINIRYIAYDIDPDEMKTAESKLSSYDHEADSENIYTKVNGSNIYKGATYTKKFGKGRVTVELFRGDLEGPGVTASDIKHNLLNDQPIDASLCMFGVLSYVRTREARVGILQTLNDVTAGPVILSVPTRNRNPITSQRFDNLRTTLEQTPIESGNITRHAQLKYLIGDAKNEGDVCKLFEKKGGGYQRMFYHMYNTAELSEDLRSAGLNDFSISCPNIKSEAKITTAEKQKGYWVHLIDAWESNHLNPNEFGDSAMFLMAEAQGQRAIDKGKPAISGRQKAYTSLDSDGTSLSVNIPPRGFGERHI